MTISEDLKIRFNKQVGRLIIIFMKEFINVKEREEFNDNRKVLFLDGNINPLVPFFFGNGEKKKESNTKKTLKTLFSTQYKQDKMIVRIYCCSEIYENTFFDTKPEIFFKNLDFFEKFFKQIAHHEYGHSFLTRTEFDEYPENARTFLRKFDYEDIDNVPLSKKNELKEAFKKDKYIKKNKELKLVELDLVVFSFKEFHAKFSVKERIDDSTPNEILKRILWEYKQTLSNNNWRERFYNTQELGIKELSNIFLGILISTQEFYIYDEWNRLIEVFNENKFNEMLQLFHRLNNIFMKIVRKNRNFDDMRCDLFKLAKVLDNFNYEKIFFKNLILEKDLILLDKFIDDFLKDEF